VSVFLSGSIMNSRQISRGSQGKEIPIHTVVAGMQASSGVLFGLNKPLLMHEVGKLALSLQRLRRSGHGIILRCRETFPYMIPVLSQVDGIISPKTTVLAKGHAAEFCREEGKAFVVADESTWGALERHEGQNVLVDSRGQRMVISPDKDLTQITDESYAPLPETHMIAELIKSGRHISLLSTVPEAIGREGKFSYFCRQEQLLTAGGMSPWELSRMGAEECCERLYSLWSQYIASIPSEFEIELRSLDARSDEYPDSPLNRERNPQLGNHGPSLFKTYPHLLQAETAAIAKLKAVNTNSKLTYLLPFVRSADEIAGARRALTDALLKQSLAERAVPLAVMFETPALLYLLDELAAAQVKAIWIGTKDLLMAFMMADRDNPDPDLQTYLNLVDNRGKLNLPFLNYLQEAVGRFSERDFEVLLYSLASELPTYAKNLPPSVGFLLSKGAVKAALTLLPD
jgi:phosphoenolpyruvate synthase/pyruvate phosphate dikinase